MRLCKVTETGLEFATIVINPKFAEIRQSIIDLLERTNGK